jgi:hypothetical protein
VKKSLVPGDSGWGLFAEKKIREGATVCGYGGVEVRPETLARGDVDRDYMAEAIKDHVTGERICMDGINELSGYGRFAQDPIDEGKVNAKLKWKDGRLVIVAMVDIAPGDEIYLHYGVGVLEGAATSAGPRAESQD